MTDKKAQPKQAEAVETLTDADMARLGDEMLEFFRASLNLDGAGGGKGAPPLDGGSSSADPSEAVAVCSFPAKPEGK